MKMTRVLVVGQTPPPYHGQAIMIEKLTSAKFDSIKIVHLRMSFSETDEEVGKFRWKKLFHLLSILLRGIFLLLFRKIDVLYYPPAGPHLIPVLRDLMLLPCWRLLAPRVIYHFRAGGLSEFLASRSVLFQLLARIAYGKPDGAIILSRLNPKDAEFLQANRIFLIPNGLEDVFDSKKIMRSNTEVRLFYIGMLHEQKGLHILLEAFRIICLKHDNVSLHLAGNFPDLTDKEIFLSRAEEYKVRGKITLYGLVTAEEKCRIFGRMDIFCFLTHYAAETFGNSVLEAMIWGLPVVATRWRGVPDLVMDQETGFLVPVRDPESASQKISLLVKDPEMRTRLGRRGRERFLQEFTLEAHLERMKSAILSSSSTSRQARVGE